MLWTDGRREIEDVTPKQLPAPDPPRAVVTVAAASSPMIGPPSAQALPRFRVISRARELGALGAELWLEDYRPR